MPITWGSLLGVIILWGRFDHPGWQRRVGLLLVMSLVDAGLWFLDHGEALGIADGNFGHEWLLGHVGQALGWAEFALLAGLSSEYLEHLGEDYARESGQGHAVDGRDGCGPLAAHVLRSDRLAGGLADHAPPVLPGDRGIPALPGVDPALGHHLVPGDGPRHRSDEPIDRVLREMQREDESGDPFGPAVGRTEEMNGYRP